jgi:ribosomal protein S12 methylthiotransferase accessory factor
MCYRMRSLACADDFDDAIAYETFLDRMKRPALGARNLLPTLTPYIGSMLATEILKYLLSAGPTGLTGRVHVFDALTFESETNDVLQRPDCPACRKKVGRGGAVMNRQSEQQDRPPGDVLEQEKALVGRYTGVVRSITTVHKHQIEPHKPYIFTAEISNHRFSGRGLVESQGCAGKGLTVAEARRGALGEAAERYAGACWHPDDIHYARRQDLECALDPHQLVLYAPEQYATIPFAPYAEANVLGWVRFRSLVDHQQCFVPAIGTLLSYAPRTQEELLCPATSNGLAAGASLAEATLRAALEVIERDAFMITWLNKLPCEAINVFGHPERELVEMCRAYSRRGIEIRLYRVPTDQPCHVYAAIGLRTGSNDLPAVTVGLAADMAPAPAARRAVLEVGQARPGLPMALRSLDMRRRLETLVADPTNVTALEDHALLYTSPKAAKWLDFILDRPCGPGDWGGSRMPSVDDQLQTLVEHARVTGGDVLCRDMTTPDIAPLGVHVARVVMPGFQPIDFGWAERRLGGDRLYELPRALGFATDRTRRDSLNAAPHPLA